MFSYFIGKLAIWFDQAEQRRRASYLESSEDLADLERRIRHIEKHGRPDQIDPDTARQHRSRVL